MLGTNQIKYDLYILLDYVHYASALNNITRSGIAMEEVLKSIGQYGFPIVVSIYLLIRFENKIDLLTASIDAMNTIISKLKV